MTHTYAILKVSPSTYAEIRRLLKAANYTDQFAQGNEGELIDMHGLAIQASSANDFAPCCECGAEYPKAELTTGEIYCRACRERMVLAILEKAKQDVEKIVAKEKAGEYIGQGIMEMRLDQTVTTKDEQRKLMEQIDSISGQGALGRKCSKCGSAMAHYRLRGYRCTNPKCDGPYGGGRS